MSIDRTTPYRHADVDRLAAVLASMLNGSADGPGHVTVIDQQPNIEATSLPTEIVTCRLADGREVRLFCKYGPDGDSGASSQASGVRYEAEVYRQVLQPLKKTPFTFYGTHEDPATGNTLLVLEYLDQETIVRASKTPEAIGTRLAARWIGSFHAASEAFLKTEAVQFLKRFDAEYYRGRALQVLQYTAGLHDQHPWLSELCTRFDEVWVELLPRVTVIHGDYYSQNVFFREGIVYPVDWEMAAVAAGEIDLATLTDGWPADMAQEFEREYQRARWPQGAPRDFLRALEAARVYVHLRWLSLAPDVATAARHQWRFKKLRLLAEGMGIT
jgi:aminoglycoside phosphotransferase (APT) family kinase protein